MPDSLSVSVQARISAPLEKTWQVLTGPAAPEVIGRQLPELHAAYETYAAAFKKHVEEGVS
jgi:hypothetical protein